MTQPTEQLHILIADDDARICALLARYLSHEGFLVSTVGSTQAIQEALASFTFDLLILDVMMPGGSGFDFLAAQPSPSLPVLFLTARSQADDRVRGLELGAADYVVKPFDPRELVLRIHRILGSRILKTAPPTFRLGAVTFDPLHACLRAPNQTLALTTREHQLLSLFIAHVGVPLAREWIVDQLAEGVSLRTIDVQVNRLRQKIEPDPKQPLYLQSVRGCGYVLRVSSSPSASPS